MNTIILLPLVGSFAENKDKAREIRLEQIIPALEKGKSIILDFTNIEGVTQSFIHALVSDLVRHYGNEIFERVLFKNCAKNVQKIINIVADYMMEGD